jgi:16S rRNA (guanine(1405)-N(7))-methyltransferase
MDERLAELVQAVLDSPKYSQIDRALVERIAREEVTKGRTIKEALKASRSKLHQVGGAYFPKTIGEGQYDAWLAQLAEKAGQPEELKAACREIMAAHASTRERLPVLDEFYAKSLAEISPIKSVIDAACGFNPLAIPWMPLADGARYYAYDIYRNMSRFLRQAMRIIGVKGTAQSRDIITTPPDEQADLALVLKTLPCLEQVDKQAGRRLLTSLDVRYMLVSFPARSLGGRRKGMEKNYAAYFESLVEEEQWTTQNFRFSNELVYLVQK